MSTQIVKDAIADFYQLNNFDEDGGASKSYVEIKFLFFSIPIPNTSSRKKNILFHDINHLITGNGTTWKGECAVASWEVASGGWKGNYVPWLLTLWAMGLGVVFYPITILEFFKKGLTMRNALTSGITKEEQLSLTISKLQERVSNLPISPMNPYLWMGISFLVFVSPFVIGLSLIWWVSSMLF